MPPISEITPLGALTVTEQFGPELWVWVPPGHLWSVSTTKLVMWKVSRPDGQPELQMMLPLSSNPVTLWPLAHDWPATLIPGGPCGPVAPVAPVSPFGPCGPGGPAGP